MSAERGHEDRADRVDPPDPAAAAVVRMLIATETTLAVAESLTGGALLDALVEVPGVSATLRGGVVAYATDLKRDLLGVDPALLSERGVVDPEVAMAMADGVRRLVRADLGVGTTGVAGPGPHGGHPAGEFHVAVTGAVAGRAVRVVRSHPGGGPGSRSGVRATACRTALDLLQDVLAGTDPTEAALDRT